MKSQRLLQITRRPYIDGTINKKFTPFLTPCQCTEPKTQIMCDGTQRRAFSLLLFGDGVLRDGDGSLYIMCRDIHLIEADPLCLLGNLPANV